MAKRYTVYLKMHVRDMKKESQQIKKLKKQLSEIQRYYRTVIDTLVYVCALIIKHS